MLGHCVKKIKSGNYDSSISMKFTVILIASFISLITVSCDSTRTLFTSSKSKKDYWTVKAYTMNHCGCTHLYVENVAHGRRVSQVEYQNEGAVKRIFTYNDQGRIAETLVLIARQDDITVPFDSLDKEIFRRLKRIVESGDGIVYELKWTEYKGYTRGNHYVH